MYWDPGNKGDAELLRHNNRHHPCCQGRSQEGFCRRQHSPAPRHSLLGMCLRTSQCLAGAEEHNPTLPQRLVSHKCLPHAAALGVHAACSSGCCCQDGAGRCAQVQSTQSLFSGAWLSVRSAATCTAYTAPHTPKCCVTCLPMCDQVPPEHWPRHGPCSSCKTFKACTLANQYGSCSCRM